MTDDERSTLFRAVLRAAAPAPVKGNIRYDEHGQYLWLDDPGSPTLMGEIRGYGAGLPQDRISEHIVQLWNASQSAG